ncbi:MAG: GAF domain-containing protein [Pseudomonadota bacterium]
MKNSSPFEDLLPGIRALCEGITDEIALMATLSCELFHGDGRCDWVGFYRVTAPELLTIGPYQGGHGCLLIPFDKGVCGAAARTGTTQLVDDVNAFEGHIACSSSTLSEIVVPLFNGQGQVFAVLDIDSDQPAAFDTADQAILEGLVAEVFAHV